MASLPAQRHVVLAMLRQLLDERRRFVLGLGVTGFVIALLTTVLYPSLGTEYDELLDEMPPALERMLGDAELGTIEGWLQVEVFSIVGPALAIAAAISLGAGSLAGREEDGQMELIAAAPVPRSWIVQAGLGAVVGAVIVVVVGLAGGVVLGGLLADLTVPFGALLAVSAALLLLASTTGTIAVAIGSLTGSRGQAMAGAAAIALASYVSTTFFPLHDTLAPWARLSLWHLFASSRPLITGLHLGHSTVLLALIVLASALSHLAFTRRDLHT